MRHGAAWMQHIHLVDDVGGKFVLIIGRGSSERVHADEKITGLPYLRARLYTDPPSLAGTILQGMRLRTRVANQWGTTYGIFPVPQGVYAMDVMIGQAEGGLVPQNGSAARMKNIDVRFFATEAAARTYEGRRGSRARQANCRVRPSPTRNCGFLIRIRRR